MSSYLPEEIILNILSRLQVVKTLLRFRYVCKSWSKLLTSHDFVKIHLDHALELNNKNDNCSIILNCCFNMYSIDSVSSSSELGYESVKIDIPFKSVLPVQNLGSCNGLFCSTRGNFVIWNPSTKEYKEISPPPNTSLSNTYGFGYDSKIDDYKIVVGFPSVNINFEVNFYTYTLGSNSWKKFQSVPHYPFVPKRSTGILLNGALHWIKANFTDGYQQSQVIISFDIGDEKFQEIELPNCLVGKRTSNVERIFKFQKFHR